MLQIAKFSNYIEEIEELKKKSEELIRESKLKLKEEFNLELSKHLKSIEHNNVEIFLIDNDFGIIVNNASYQHYNKQLVINLNPAYIKNGRWVSQYNSIAEEYRTNYKISIANFVIDYIKKLKKHNIKRKKNKESRELKKSINKYNL